jgi:penicillin-binding protein 1C
MTGLTYAAPVLFDIFKALRPKGWFYAPYDDMEQLPVCHYSGYRATPNCEIIDTVWVQKKGIRTGVCPYHQLVHLDKTEKWRVTSDCESVDNMVTKTWFVLPPVMEYYFQTKNPFYKILPPYRPDCASADQPTRSMDIIYPKENSRLYVPYDLDGKKQKFLFKVAHRISGTKIYWYLDQQYLGSTEEFHQMGLAPEAGHHILVLVDQTGESMTRNFEIIDKKKKGE